MKYKNNPIIGLSEWGDLILPYDKKTNVPMCYEMMPLSQEEIDRKNSSYAIYDGFREARKIGFVGTVSMYIKEMRAMGYYFPTDDLTYRKETTAFVEALSKKHKEILKKAVGEWVTWLCLGIKNLPTNENEYDVIFNRDLLEELTNE